MPKILLLETIIVNYGDDRGGQAEEAGALVTVPVDTATLLTRHGRALYARRADDPTKGKLTAPADVIAAAEARAEDLAAPAETTPESDK